MALISRDQYTTPQNYSEISSTAESDARLAAAYALVAEATNCGGTAVLFQQPLTEAEVETLKQSGITATENKQCVYPGRQWMLRWEK